MEFQESEIINLVLAVISVCIVVFLFREKEIQVFKWIYAGYFAIVASFVFTVVEGVFWKDFFNHLEHLSVAIAGLAFAVGCLTLYRQAVIRKERDR